MSSYQQVTISVIVKGEDVESVKREFNQTLEMLEEDDYKLHQTSVVAEECDEPEEDEDEDLITYEDAA